MKDLKVAAALTFMCLLACSCRLADKSPWDVLQLESAGPLQAARTPSWDALDLSSVKLDGATLHYEKCLEPKLGVFRGYYERFLTERDGEIEQAQKLLERSKEIVAEVNRIVGVSPDEALNAEMERVLKDAFGVSVGASEAFGKADVYFVTRATVKDYLRNGGELPGFTYDSATDTATHRLGLTVIGTARTQNDQLVVSELEFIPRPAMDNGGLSLPFRVTSPDTVREDLEVHFSKAAGHLRAFLPGTPFHELAELSILQRLRPYDPYYRWFSDGFANAITLRLMEKYVGEEAAQQFTADFDHSEYADIEKETNLYYWMGNRFCIDTPLESEGRMSGARYACATFEAERFIQKHGIESIARILDRACRRPFNNSRNLTRAIRKLTGEDMERRFRRYQTFESKRSGVKKYTARFNAAVDRKDYAEALFNLLRMMELRPQQAGDYGSAACLLFLMGYERTGDRAIRERLNLVKGPGSKKARLALQQVFIMYALKCRNLSKAYQVAEEVLDQEPDFVPALAARMDKLLSSGKLSEAREVARRILELEKHKDSAPYKLAEAVLAIKADE